jgi:methionyl-tRNA formyltransferase
VNGVKPEGIIIIGTGRLACHCLEACLAFSLPVRCVESEKQAFSPLAALCRKRSVKYEMILERERLTDLFLSIAKPTLVVSSFNYFLFPKKVLENGALNVVNFHNSLLPEHRGRNAPSWSIYAMETVTGITWHQVHAQVDTGDIIVQRRIEIGPDVTALELTLKTLDVAGRAFEEILPSLLDGSYACARMVRTGKESLHRSVDVPNGGRFDLGWSIEQAYAFLRALDYGKFRVFPAPKVRILDRDFSIASYQFERHTSMTSGELGVAWSDKRLTLSSGGKKLLLNCE